MGYDGLEYFLVIAAVLFIRYFVWRGRYNKINAALTSLESRVNDLRIETQKIAARQRVAMVGAFLGLRGSFMTILLGTLLGSVLGLALIIALYAIGWKRRLAERASRRGLGKVASLRWAIASQYQLPLGTFLGIGALVVVFLFSSPLINLAPRMP